MHMYVCTHGKARYAVKWMNAMVEVGVKDSCDDHMMYESMTKATSLKIHYVSTGVPTSQRISNMWDCSWNIPY